MQAVTDGHEMGNHTIHHCHADLTGCSTGSATSLDAELDDCNVSVVTGSIVHAQTAGDIWLDTMVAVGAYWRGQRAVSVATPTTNADGSQTWSWTLPAHFPPGKFVRVTVDGGTLSQNGMALPWDGHGYYEVVLDAGQSRFLSEEDLKKAGKCAHP
jgi:hypothetical protein